MCMYIAFALAENGVLTTYDFRDYVPLVDLLGEYFQVRDDYMNLDSPAVRLLIRCPTVCVTTEGHFIFYSTPRVKASLKI